MTLPDCVGVLHRVTVTAADEINVTIWNPTTEVANTLPLDVFWDLVTWVWVKDEDPAPPKLEEDWPTTWIAPCLMGCLNKTEEHRVTTCRECPKRAVEGGPITFSKFTLEVPE